MLNVQNDDCCKIYQDWQEEVVIRAIRELTYLQTIAKSKNEAASLFLPLS